MIDRSASSKSLVEQLVADLKPVRSVPIRSLMIASSAGLLVYCLLFSSLFYGWRADWARHFMHPLFFAVLIALAGQVFCSLRLGMKLSVPGTPISLATKVAPGVFFLLFNLLLFGVASPAGSSAREGLNEVGFQCTGILLMIALVPLAASLWLMKQLAPTQPRLVGQLIALLVGAGGALGLCLHCPFDHFVHLLLYHSLPIILVTLVLPWTTSRWLRW